MTDTPTPEDAQDAESPDPSERLVEQFISDESALNRVRRIGALGPETEHARETIDRLAAAFQDAGIGAESVSAVPVGERAILVIDVGEAGAAEIVRFLGGLLASELEEPVVGLLGNHAFTHRLNVALDAAGQGTDLLLPDEIIWVIPESLEQTMRELDQTFPNSPADEDSSPADDDSGE